MVIDLSFLSDTVSDLNFFFTNLARSEQMKDIDMKNKSFRKSTDEDIASTVVNVEYTDNQISLRLTTNENNESSVWKNNFVVMAKSLLQSKIEELIRSYGTEIWTQMKSYIFTSIGGAFA